MTKDLYFLSLLTRASYILFFSGAFYFQKCVKPTTDSVYLKLLLVCINVLCFNRMSLTTILYASQRERKQIKTAKRAGLTEI